jgi:3-methyladenine DNA glycosylase AlkD
MNVLIELQSLSDEEYKAFNRRIIPTKQRVLGVRVPVLRKVAKNIAKHDAYSFIESDKGNVYEMIMLEGMVLSYLKKPFGELLPQTEIFLHKVDNWAQIDSTIADFKNIAHEREDVLEIVMQWLHSDKEFVVRAGLVILLAYYVDKTYLNTVFRLFQSITHSRYYVYMANAWLVSVCMAKYPEETILFFRNNTLDTRTHNKAIQKSRESFRVSQENKAIINELKIT